MSRADSDRGAVSASGVVAAVHDVTTFAEPVPFTARDGTYSETGSATMTNFANGVRRMSDEVIDRILGMVGEVGGQTGVRLTPAPSTPASLSVTPSMLS